MRRANNCLWHRVIVQRIPISRPFVLQCTMLAFGDEKTIEYHSTVTVTLFIVLFPAWYHSQRINTRCERIKWRPKETMRTKNAYNELTMNAFRWLQKKIHWRSRNRIQAQAGVRTRRECVYTQTALRTTFHLSLIAFTMHIEHRSRDRMTNGHRTQKCLARSHCVGTCLFIHRD